MDRNICVRRVLKWPTTWQSLKATSTSPKKYVRLKPSYMGVSKNRGGPPKSSILIWFWIINHPFWGTIIFGNTHNIVVSKHDPGKLLPSSQFSMMGIKPHRPLGFGVSNQKTHSWEGYCGFIEAILTLELWHIGYHFNKQLIDNLKLVYELITCNLCLSHWCYLSLYTLYLAFISKH